MAKEYKLDIFNLLSNVNAKNTKFYGTLSDEEIKEITPFVLMRWLSGTNDAYQIYMLNEVLNPFVFKLSKHKELLVDLMVLSASGQTKRCKYVKTKSKKTTNTPKAVAVIKQYFGYSTLDAIEALPLLTNANIVSFAEDLGTQKPELAALKKEIKARK